MDTDRKYVLFVATGVGLGHLLTALLNSAYYAYRTGRVLVLDMREFQYVSGDKHAGFFEHFSLVLPHDLEVITDLDVVERLRKDDDLHFLQLETDRLIVDRPFTARVLLIPCLIPGEPYPISAKRSDLPFHVSPRGKLLEAWHAVMGRPEWAGAVIGLHYRSVVGEVTERMSKALTPDYEERYREVKDRYIATALQVAKDAGYINPAFLVTSDDTDFVSYVRERLPNAFSLATRLPDQEWAAWVRANGHDFSIMSEAVNDLWCLSACDHLVHFRSGFSHFAILNSTKLDQATAHYVHVPSLKETLESLGPEEAVTWARSAARKADARRIQLRYLCDWLADALDRAGQPEAAARERRRAQWYWDCHQHPVVDNPDKPRVEGRAQHGDYTGLLGVAQRAVAELPDNPYWLAGYGSSLSNVLAAMGRWQDAIPPARQAVEMAPEDPFLHEHLGSVLSGAGAPDEGERAIRQAIAMDSAVSRFHKALADCLMRQNRGAEAVAAFREAVQLDPDDLYMRRRMGAALVALGDYAAAEATFRQALAIREEAGIHIDLYDCFSRQRRFDDALAEARAAVAMEPTNPHWHFRVALTLMHAGRLPEAEAAARMAVAHGTGESAFRDLLAQVLQRQGRMHEVVATMQQAAEQEPQDAQRQLRLAQSLLESQQFAEAEQAARRAAELQPDLVAAHDLLSQILERQKRLPEAAVAARRAVELVPNDGGRHNRVGHLLFQAGDMPGAEQALLQTVRLTAEAPTFHVHHLLGIVLERQDRIQEAIAEARKANDLEPENADLIFRLAALLWREKQAEEAEALVRKAVTLRPEEERFRRFLASVVGERAERGRPQESAAANSLPEEPVAEEAEPTETLAQEPAPAEVFAEEAEPAERIPEPVAPAEAFARKTEAAEPTRQQTQQRSSRLQWLSGTALPRPLRQMLTGKPKSDA